MVLNHNSRILSSIIVVVVVVMTGSPADFHFPYQIKNPRDPAPQESVNTWDRLGLTKFWSDWVHHDMVGVLFILAHTTSSSIFCCSIIIIIDLYQHHHHLSFQLWSQLTFTQLLIIEILGFTDKIIHCIQYPTRSRMSRKENSNTAALILI